MSDLEQQRRLTDSRITGKQRHGTGHHAAAQYPVELVDARRAVLADVGLDGADRNGARRRIQGTTGTDRAQDGHLVHSAPGAAFSAAADPFGADVLALRATVLRARICHVMTVSGGDDKPAVTLLRQRV